MVYVQEILDRMNLCVVLPVYNEAKAIKDLIAEIKKYVSDIVVIDDGSTDDTLKIVRDCSVVLLSNQKNIGKGASLSKGFEYALKNKFDGVITMDGDGQHAPCDIPRFLDLSKSLSCHVIVGNRMTDLRSMPRIRVLTNKFLSRVISLVVKQHIPDSQCGFRLITRPVLEKVTTLTNNYEAESEILIKAARAGFRIDSVSITTIYCGSKSSIHPFLDTFRFFKFLFKEIF